MSAKHTPGPWVPVSDTQVDGFTRVRVACEEGKAGLVATCSGCRKSTDEDEANARLIAAAPELADALEAILASDGFRGVFDASALHAAHGRAEIALRKAGRLP